MGLLSSKEWKRYEAELRQARNNKDYVKVYNLEVFKDKTGNMWDRFPTLLQFTIILFAPIYFVGGMIAPFLIK